VHSNYHSHHTCSTTELAKACNDSQINQNLTTQRFWNVMSDLMLENGEPFSLNNSSSQFLCIWTSIQKPTTRTWLVVATWLVAEEGSIAATHQSWELCFFFSLWHIISVHASEVARCWLFNKELLLSSQDQGSEASGQLKKNTTKMLLLRNKRIRRMASVELSNLMQNRNTYSYQVSENNS
jgi:hypothetical protein